MKINISHGTVFNLAFAFYALVGQVIILGAVKSVFFDEQSNIILGLMIFGVLIAEVVGLAWKLPQVYARSGKTIARSNWLLLIWIGHLALGTVLAILGFQALGLDHDINQTAFMIIVSLGIVREFIILGLLGLAPAKKIVAKKEFIADILLFIFACVSYTAFWEAMVDDLSGLGREGFSAEVILAITMMTFIFVLFFLPTRMSYLIEDVLFLKTKKDKLWWTVSFLLAVLLALAPLII